VVLVAVVAVLSGCSAVAPAVVLDKAPERSASEEARKAYVDKNRALGPVTVAQQGFFGAGAALPVTTTFLQLADGRRVEDPAALLPALDPESASARAAKASMAARDKAATLGGVATAMSGIGLGVAAASAISALTAPALPADERDVATFSSAAGAVVGLAAVLVSTTFFGQPANEAAHEAAVDAGTAFATFNDSLSAHLGLAAVAPPSASMGSSSAPSGT
ncbi:MAG TPA: hypothetical protein VGO62_07765, partial [Myxococcota bacterium]